MILRIEITPDDCRRVCRISLQIVKNLAHLGILDQSAAPAFQMRVINDEQLSIDRELGHECNAAPNPALKERHVGNGGFRIPEP